MKNTFTLLLLLFLSSCSKDNDNKVVPEIDKLPPATQVGANTFGCLLDGKAYLPGNYQNAKNCFYQFVDDGYYFGLTTNKKDELYNLIGISLGTINLQIQEGFTYNLLGYSDGNAVGAYSYTSNSAYTSIVNSGELTITKLSQTTVSGTFWFDIVDYQGNFHQIREGRFDMEYSN